MHDNASYQVLKSSEMAVLNFHSGLILALFCIAEKIAKFELFYLLLLSGSGIILSGSTLCRLIKTSLDPATSEIPLVTVAIT